MPLRQPMPVLFVGEPIVLRFAPIQGKLVAQLAGADSRHFAKGVALTGSMRPLSGNGRRHERGEQRPNPRFHNHHHRPAARADDGCPFLEPCQSPARSEFQQHMQQGNQALTVRMQKAEVARTPEPFGQHMLNTSHKKCAPGTVRRSIFPVLAHRYRKLTSALSQATISFSAMTPR